MRLTRLDGEYAIARRVPGSAPPVPPAAADLYVVAVTADEVSIVAASGLLAAEAVVESGWACYRVEGSMDFDVVGVLAGITAPLAAAGIPLFAVSTFDTDYVLIKVEFERLSVSAWREAGIAVTP